MKTNRNLVRGSATMLILKLISERDMYGYEMIEILEERSNHIFSLKAGTLYPILHSLELSGSIDSYESDLENSRRRKYYSITSKGRDLLELEKNQWRTYIDAIENIMNMDTR